MTRAGPFRGGKIHVLKAQCATCVFRPGNRMHLAAGRLKDLITGNSDSALTCHQTLPYYPGDAEPAICRGFYDKYGDQSYPIRLARELELIVEDPVPPEEKQ